jgi:hypothetical protein
MNGQLFTKDIPLTNVSQAYLADPAQFIAEKVFPVVMTRSKNFNIYYYGKENLKKVVDDTRARFGETKQAELSVTTKPFCPLVGHELKDGIDFDQDHFAESPLNLEVDITNFLSEQMAVSKEQAAAALYSDTSKVTQYSTPTYAWDDYVTGTANSDPIADLEMAAEFIRKYGLRPANKLTMSYRTFRILRNHPNVIVRVKYANTASLTMELLLDLLGQVGITEILVSSAVVDSTAEGLAPSNGFVWGNHVWLSFVTGTPGLRQVNSGYTFVLEGGRYVDTWFEQGKKTKWIRNNDYYHQAIVGAEGIYMLRNVVS